MPASRPPNSRRKIHQYSLPQDFRAFFGALDYAVIGRKL
jgi:hypothetical protein